MCFLQDEEDDRTSNKDKKIALVGSIKFYSYLKMYKYNMMKFLYDSFCKNFIFIEIPFRSEIDCIKYILGIRWFMNFFFEGRMGHLF